METYLVIGLMSGTSLDGVDAAACELTYHDGKWDYLIHHACTYPYPEEWIVKLSGLPGADALTYAKVNVDYGHYLGQLVSNFMKGTGFPAQMIASHGHTIFHQPAAGLTSQVGAGSALAAETGLPVVCDFRTKDVALGGQGAPLVPLGDRLLFGQYGACLNLGGFANISMESGNSRIAFDICPVNIVLNKLAGKIGLSYDPEGENARKGKVIVPLLHQLNALGYYVQPYPKSLGREWVETNIDPLIFSGNFTIPDLLRTYCEHVAGQVNLAVGLNSPVTVVVTGGGARNTFLMELINRPGKHRWMMADAILTDYKEALVFALLGVLRWRGEINILSSVTGCRFDHSGGAIYIR